MSQLRILMVKIKILEPTRIAKNKKSRGFDIATHFGECPYG